MIRSTNAYKISLPYISNLALACLAAIWLILTTAGCATEAVSPADTSTTTDATPGGLTHESAPDDTARAARVVMSDAFIRAELPSGEPAEAHALRDDAPKSACERMCEAVDACAPVVGLGRCAGQCELALYEGALGEREVDCVLAAKSCAGIEVCAIDLFACDAGCDAVMGCYPDDDPIDCRLWCGFGVLRGDLSLARLACLETHERTGACDAMYEVCAAD